MGPRDKPGDDKKGWGGLTQPPFFALSASPRAPRFCYSSCLHGKAELRGVSS